MVEEKNRLVEEEESTNLLDWLFLAFKRWKVVLIVFLVVASAASYRTYIKVKSQKAIYISTVRLTLGPGTLEVKTKEGNVVERKYTSPDEIELIGSSLVADQAARILKEKYGYEGSEEKLALEVKGALRIRIPKGRKGLVGANVITISAVSHDPQKAFDIISATLEGYRKQKEQDEKEFFQKSYATFSEQLDTAHKELLKAENTLAAYIVDNEEVIKAMEAYGMSDQEDKDVISASLNERILKLQADISNTEKFILTVKGLAETNRLSALYMISKRYSQLVDVELKELLLNKEETLRRLLTINEEAHPSVIQARGEKEAIEKKVDDEITNAIQEIEEQLDTLQSQEKKLSSLIKSGLYEKLITYNMLKRDIIIKRKVYNNLSEALHQIDLGEKMKYYIELRILEPHKLPVTGIKEFPIRDLVPGLILAIACSMAAIYLLERLDTSIKDIEDVEKSIDLPVLATIPAYYKRRKRKSKEG